MIEMSPRGQRPLNWNVLTVDSHEPERSRIQLGSDRGERRRPRVVALTMPTLVGLKMSFLNYCALNMLPGWGESSRCRSRADRRSCVTRGARALRSGPPSPRPASSAASRRAAT